MVISVSLLLVPGHLAERSGGEVQDAVGGAGARLHEVRLEALRRDRAINLQPRAIRV